MNDVVRDNIREKLTFLYGRDSADEVLYGIIDMLKYYQPLLKNTRATVSGNGRRRFSQSDIVISTYPDQVSSKNEKSLRSLIRFLRGHVSGLANIVHILPFYPYSSDDGFSVIDYKEVNPSFGGWGDIEETGRDFDLMFDAVINHVSAKSEWFRKYISGKKAFKNLFIETNPAADLSGVTRPRSLPLLTKFNTNSGEKWLWTTFSPDQVDLNYSSPETLLAMVDVLLFYVSQGAKMLRLDAVGYLWKKIGTSCVHLPETHTVIKLVRQILDEAAPSVSLITETNVPHCDNISYFGRDGDEAQMVYNFSLPPLAAHAILRENSEYLTSWAAGLNQPECGCTYLNFTASHDGIGVTPAAGLLPLGEIDFLCRTALERGGRISTRSNAGGDESPYELNINYLSFLKGGADPDETTAAKFIVSQAIMLAMPGVPCIYFHSLFGSTNFQRGIESGSFRSINREKLDIESLETELGKKDSLRSLVFGKFKGLLLVRKEEEAFSPHASFKFPALGKGVFSVLRNFDGVAPLLALHSVSSKKESACLKDILAIEEGRELIDIVTGEPVLPDKKQCVQLAPWQVMWLKTKTAKPR